MVWLNRHMGTSWTCIYWRPLIHNLNWISEFCSSNNMNGLKPKYARLAYTLTSAIMRLLNQPSFLQLFVSVFELSIGPNSGIQERKCAIHFVVVSWYLRIIIASSMSWLTRLCLGVTIQFVYVNYTLWHSFIHIWNEVF